MTQDSQPAPRLQWSRWFRCESSFSLILVPSCGGVFAIAEEVVAPAAAGNKRMLAVFGVDQAENLSRALSRLFTAASPLQGKFVSGRCFVRFAVVEDPTEREAAVTVLNHWLAASADSASGLAQKSDVNAVASRWNDNPADAPSHADAVSSPSATPEGV